MAMAAAAPSAPLPLEEDDRIPVTVSIQLRHGGGVAGHMEGGAQGTWRGGGTEHGGGSMKRELSQENSCLHIVMKSS